MCNTTHVLHLSDCSFFVSQENPSMRNGNDHKCSLVIEMADQAIHGSSEACALANSTPQNHHWVNFVPQ